MKITFYEYLKIFNNYNLEYKFIQLYPNIFNIIPDEIMSYKKLKDILKEHIPYIEYNILFKDVWLNYFKYNLISDNEVIIDNYCIGR
jgi:hypothetical protein